MKIEYDKAGLRRMSEVLNDVDADRDKRIRQQAKTFNFSGYSVGRSGFVSRGEIFSMRVPVQQLPPATFSALLGQHLSLS